jgi:acetyltransferase-like isoleucine patch superfamily enzyme
MFFSEMFASMPEMELEEFYKTVFMVMDSPYAEGVRLQYYKQKLKHMGENVKIGCGVNMINPQYISLCDNVKINDNCTLIARGEKGIRLDDGVELKHGVYLDTESPAGYIEVGKEVYIGTGCCLHGHQGLEIGDYCLLAQNITITPYSHIFEIKDELIRNQGGHTRKVVIGRDCYIGMNCCVLYSADIGEGSVIGSGSVVVHTVPSYSVAVGVPAKVIRKRGPTVL